MADRSCQGQDAADIEHGGCQRGVTCWKQEALYRKTVLGYSTLLEDLVAACVEGADVNYELYHDESKKAGYWHGILLVPEAEKRRLVDLLSQARQGTGYPHPLSMKCVTERKKNVLQCAQCWISLGVAALASCRRPGVDPVAYRVMNRNREVRYAQLDPPIGAKFVVLRERDNLASMAGPLDYGAKVETTFRMAAKGGLHYLGSAEEPMCITRMHFDGWQHYRRHLDRERIVGRLYGLRPYCSISPRADLIDDGTSDHRKQDAQSYDDCQLLQLTDLLIGCFRVLLGAMANPCQVGLAYPVRELLLRYQQGRARMQNSRWRNSFCVSECYLQDGQWRFGTLEYLDQNDYEQKPLM